MRPKTLKYILKRIAMAVFTVWIVITVTFFVMRAVPGGPFLSERPCPRQPRRHWRPNTAWTSL